MVNFKEAQDVDSFVGPRAGLVGEGHLFEGLNAHPDSVVILDEIEKAHPSIISEFLLPIFSDGTLQVVTGIFPLCTSGLGQEVWGTCEH